MFSRLALRFSVTPPVTLPLRVAALLSLLPLAACGGHALTCREPDVSVYTVEGEPAGLCDLTFSRCEDESYLQVSCNNDTFEGDYTCGWLWLRGARTRSGTFDSPDFCTLDTAGMVEAINAGTELTITIE